MKIYTAKTPSAKVYIALFLLFTSLLIALYYNSLDYYWVWEDLHLVRIFSTEEILSTFHNTWDVDNVETPGLRPVTVVFNHVRCYLFGENLPAHKIFIILIFSVYLVLTCYVGNRYFKIKLIVLLMSCFLMIGCKYNCIHILWQISSNRILQYLLFLLSLFYILNYLENSGVAKLLYSIVFYALALFTREDTIAAIPILFILSFAYERSRNNAETPRRYYGVYVAVIILVTILFLIFRKCCIPQVTLLHSMFGSRGGLKGILLTMKWSLCPFGELSLWSVNISLCWVLLFNGLFILSLILFNRYYRSSILVLFICFCSACTPGYIISKPDILFLPFHLFSLIFAMMLYKYAIKSKISLWLSSILYLCLLFLATITNYAQQQSFHPYSTEQISREYDFLHGEYAQTTIPSQRRGYLTEKFKRLGLTEDDFKRNTIFKKAQKATLLAPKRHNSIFLPKFRSWKP